MSAAAAELWTAVDRRLDRAVDSADGAAELQGSGLTVLAAHRRHTRGLPVPEVEHGLARTAAAHHLLATALLERVREVVPGRVVVLKGVEVAAHYRSPGQRLFGDLDLLCSEPHRAQEDLIADGFAPTLDSTPGHHHLAPLAPPASSVFVEVHERLAFEPWARAPTTAQLLAEAEPSASGVAGTETLRPDHHALFLLDHAWRNGAPGTERDLIDVAALAVAAHPEQPDLAAALAAIAPLARAWGLDRTWAVATGALLDGVFHDRPAFSVRALRATGQRNWVRTHRVLARAVGAPGWRAALRR